MISINLTGQSVLITGGTKGIGLATGLAFAKAGANVFLTHKWGSADEADLAAKFTAVNGPAPTILQADVSNKDDLEAVLNAIGEKHSRLDAFISNASFSLVPKGFDDYKQRSLQTSIDYSTWPLVSHLHAAKKKFGAYPKYAVALSSDGPDSYYPGYDFVAASKAVLETLVKYISAHLLPHGCRVNVLRCGIVLTESFKATFGKEFVEYLSNQGRDFTVSAEECAATCLAMCSGLMDGMTGHVLVVDRGSHLRDNLVNLYTNYGLMPKTPAN